MKRNKALRIAKHIYKDLCKRNSFTHIQMIDVTVKKEIYNAWADIIQEESIEL